MFTDVLRRDRESIDGAGHFDVADDDRHGVGCGNGERTPQRNLLQGRRGRVGR